ncbi:MAG: ergothioneine biosynthesis protein EgtB [Terriglobales bacterium]|jgi:ergothioneine biosynthesis protein EgtB
MSLQALSPACQSAETTRTNLTSRSIADRYAAVRGTTEKICSPLTADDQMVQSAPETSPVKWHQAHTTWFFETFILAPYRSGYRSFDPAYRLLFNSYYKQVGAHPLRTTRSSFSRPSLQETQNYRGYVDEEMEHLLAVTEEPALLDLVELGLNHEQQHQELILTDIKHAFWTNPLRPVYKGRDSQMVVYHADAPKLDWIAFDGGLCKLGDAGSGFAFDNERPRHTTFLQPFRLASRLVTNAEYLAFMEDGGYRRPELWLSDGWDAIQAHGWDSPLFWERSDTTWMTFTLAGMSELHVGEPVCHVSYYEADAFARWAGARLPREAEWEIAARDIPVEGNLLENWRFHPTALSTTRNEKREAIFRLFGDVWEWTESPYVAYPGFQPASGALGEYNGKFMCNQLVLRGGSCVTPRSHIRASYRNFFPPQARWQFMGIRLANGRV